MNRRSKILNRMLVETYRQINEIEEKSITMDSNINLTISELHLLESVGKNKEGCTISFIANDQNITLPSVTVAVNKLVKKGYVEKQKSDKDARQVLVKLTRLGRKVNASHQYFHENMVRSILKEFSEEEQDILMKGVEKLNAFLEHKLENIQQKIDERREKDS